MKYETIICKNCQRHSYNDYYDFCSVWCFVDFASKNDLSFSKLKKMSDQYKNSVSMDYHELCIKEFKDDIKNLEIEIERMRNKYE